MFYFWKSILSMVPSMIPACIAGFAAVRLIDFTGYSGVVAFALPYSVLFSVCLYAFSMNEEERALVITVLRRLHLAK